MAALIMGMASPAMAAPQPKTRLTPCGVETCLLISGRRANAGTGVRINGHVVDVEGTRAWRVRLPVETVRSWSALHARSVEVTLVDPSGGGASVAEADLPIGLLGHVTTLASLVVRVR